MSTLIPLYSSVQIPATTLTTFLKTAYAPNTGSKFTLIPSQNPDGTLSAAQTPASNPFQTAELDDFVYAAEYIQNLEGKDGVEDTIFAVFDQVALDKQNVLVGDKRGQQWVRSDWGAVLNVIEALKDGKKGWPDVWLQAGVSGGVVRASGEGQGVEWFSDRSGVKSVCEQLVKKAPNYNEEGDQATPVFVTADVGVEAINQLLESAGEDSEEGLSILSTTSPDRSTGTTKGPLQNFDSPFLGKDLLYLLNFVHDKLGPLLLDHAQFLVVDEHSLKTEPKSVLMVNTQATFHQEMDAPGGEKRVWGARVGFNEAATCLSEGAGDLQEWTTEGAVKGGIFHF